jgi:hypothetical protein
MSSGQKACARSCISISLANVAHDANHVQNVQGRHFSKKTQQWDANHQFSRQWLLKMKIYQFEHIFALLEFSKSIYFPSSNGWLRAVDPWRIQGVLVWVTLGQRSYCMTRRCPQCPWRAIRRYVVRFLQSETAMVGHLNIGQRPITPPINETLSLTA